jgi:3-hydroxyacyl-[acyl-carrier-protein] dehydratase
MIDLAKDKALNIPEIKKFQRNRHPLLFIDKITKLIPGKEARGLKCFSYNEWFFPSHFDDEPNVPGFIQIESLVQTFIMTFLSLDECKGRKTNFVSIDKAKFNKKIVPGDTLTINAFLKSFKRGMAKGNAESFVNNDAACSAEFIIIVPDVFDNFKPK